MAPRVLTRGVGAVRRATPPAVVPALVRARLRRALRDEALLARARDDMEFLVGVADPAADLDALARRYVERWVWRAELRWRPEMITRQRVEGLEHLVAAQSRGLGVIANFMHHGQYDGVFGSIARHGVVADIVVHPKMLGDDAPEHLRQHARAAAHLNPLRGADLGFAGLTDLVREGRVVAIASDSPGSTELTFVGRRVRGSSGAARIACLTGAPVVLVTTERDERGPHVRIAAPLDPVAFGSPEGLLAAMVRHHERAVLAWPEAADSPRSRWGEIAAAVRQRP